MRDITLAVEMGMQMNIRIDERQKIIETLHVLEENGKIVPSPGLQKIYSQRRGRYVNVLLTYEQAEIYSGDRLIIKNDKTEGDINS